ncbi:MAG: FIST C-terminal domain-containing protein [Curvibacter sp.]|nr:FIST C-terminal domain-containing protein [Curvibacter sp.]
MRIRQVNLSTVGDWQALEALRDFPHQLLLVFGDKVFFETPALHEELCRRFPGATILGCSTAGEISAQGVTDGSCVLTAVHFEHTALRLASTGLAGMEDSRAAGRRLGEALAGAELQAVLVYGPGVAVNGSALVGGLEAALDHRRPITGGLAGDGGAFARTWVMHRDAVSDHAVVALGLYGRHLRLGHGSAGGWVPFGPARRVTRAQGNVLFELDGEAALTIYKRYLGEHARGLPGSGLLFPFLMEDPAQEGEGLIRTILAINEADGSLTLAGEVRQDSFLKLMQASTDRLIDGAERAAELARASWAPESAELAILVSCVGRKMIMGNQVDEEVEAVSGLLGPRAVLCGFYSNGEISPLGREGACQLHNQTMTITVLEESQEPACTGD